jgi:hypothetical protein
MGFGGGLAQGKGAIESWAGTYPNKGEAWGAVGLDPTRGGGGAFIKICLMVIV